MKLAFVVLAATLSANACSPSDAGEETRAVLDVPEVHGWVSDHASPLSQEDRAELESLLSDFEARTQVELAVLTVPTTGTETIEEFSLRVANEWGVGKKGLDNGLLIVVARDDRRARIEVAEGLSQGPVPDSVAQTVLRDHLVPAFAEGRFAEGLDSGIRAVMSVVEP